MFVARIASARTTRLERAEELVLDREVLERGLDHDVAVGEVGELGGQLQPPDRVVARGLLERPLLDLARQEVRDRSRACSPRVELDLVADVVEARLERELRDPRAHRAQADDTDDLHRLLDDSGDRHAEADAHRRDAVARVAPVELVERASR